MFDEVGSSPQTRYQPRAGIVNFPSNTNISNSQRNFLDLAARMAETSEAVFKHGAVIVRGGRVLSLGVNKWKNKDLPPTPPEVYNPDITVHAEIDALSRVKNPRGVTIYVARVTRQGEERFSRPCARCEKALIKAGVKRVIYTTG
jgi:deoxycytidylate deaminase